MTAVIEAKGLTKSFPVQRNLLGRIGRWTHAVKGVSLKVGGRETLGLVGETGAGKSTVGRLLLRLIEPDAGVVRLHGVDLTALRGKDLRAVRAKARMIFQDPFSSLDPRMVVADAVGEPLTVHEGIRGSERRRRVLELFQRVGLGAHQMDRYPYEFSGGQLQRMAVARAISTNPDLIVCDEAVAALDMSIRAQVINLLRDLQEERGMAYVFITHDLSLVRLIAHRLAVMYKGRIVELGETETVFTNPRHPYTQALVEAIPLPDPDRRRGRTLKSIAEEQLDLPGCDYADRCPLAIDVCRVERPELRTVGGVDVACHLQHPDT